MSEQQQAELIKTDSMSHERNARRVARDEAELQELLKQAGMQTDEETTEETPEAEPDSSESVAEPVQAESSTEQEEAEPVKAKAQESDDTELSAEEKSFKKRYSDIRRHMQDKEQEWKIKFEKLESQLNAAAKNELVLPKSEQDIEAWAKKYPDVAGIVEAIADRKASERAADLDGRLKEIEELRIQAKRDKAEAELLNLHPDFETIRADDSFHNWAEEQPKWVQDALYENSDDAKSGDRVIKLYKVDSGIKAVKPSSSSDQSAASSVRTKHHATPNEDDSSNYTREDKVVQMSMN